MQNFVEVNGIFSEHYTNLLPPYTREAPTYFEKGGRRYLFTSGTSGYYPNMSQVCVFDDFHGEYEDLGNPHIGDDSNTSFSSRITCVLKVPGKELKHSEKTCKSTYVWLPIEWQGEKPVIRWHDEWRIEDYK